MIPVRICLAVLACGILAHSPGLTSDDAFRATRLAGSVFLVECLADGDAQVVIASDGGLAVLNSFWSEARARQFRAGIAEALQRDDFACLIDLIDRPDRCGGNGAYADVPILAHRGFLDRYQGREDELAEVVAEMARVWRWKESVERERLPTLEPGSDRALRTERYLNKCKRRADDLEAGYSLVLPTETYADRKTVELGGISLELVWFGRTDCLAMTAIVIPEEGLAILPDDALSPLHLAPYPRCTPRDLDVTRWIQVLEEILEGEGAVDRILLCDFLNVLWSRERAHLHLDYIRRLWNGVRAADAQGLSLRQVHDARSLDGGFAFVKDFPVYRDRGDEWVREQHHCHVKMFFLQGKTLASRLIGESDPGALPGTVAEIRRRWEQGGDIYIEEAALNAVGYELMGQERCADAVLVLGLNVEVHPGSANAYDSYADALMKGGDAEGAVRNYRRSLELDPGNDNARNMLERLAGS